MSARPSTVAPAANDPRIPGSSDRISGLSREAAGRRKMPHFEGDPSPSSPPLWLLVLISFSGTLAMHIFVPALPYAATDLGATAGQMQQTVSLYILGLAFGQLIYGPVSDRFGRRPTLIFGLALYAISGLVAALAPEAHTLIAARLFQALGGCAGLVLARAIVRDTSTASESARRLALLNLMVTLGPGFAPVIGSALGASGGWRSIFYVLCALGTLGLVFTVRLLPETRRPLATTERESMGRTYRHLLSSPAFVGFAIGGGCCTTAMYAFIASAPFIVVNDLHVPLHQVGFYLAIPMIGTAAGSAVATRLFGRVSLRPLLITTQSIGAVATLVLLATTMTATLSIPLMFGAMFVFSACAGIASPAALTLATSIDPKAIGSASGLYGCCQMVIGALCTALVGLGGDPAQSAAIVLAAAAIIGQLSFRMALRRSQQ